MSGAARAEGWAWTEQQGSVPLSDAAVPLTDRGFLFGDAVFETLRAYGDNLFAWSEHLERLRRSAAALGIPVPWSDELLRTRAAETVTACRGRSPEVSDSALRLIVTRGDGTAGIAPGSDPAPALYLLARPYAGLSPSSYERGVAVRLVTRGRSGVPRDVKSSNYLANVMATGTARDGGAHEALFVEPDGRLSEGATSNVFAVLRGRLRTPPADGDLLPGITRELVLQLAETLGIEHSEMPLTVGDLAGAEEVFLTSTLRELLPVVRVGDHGIGDGVPGPVYRRLHEAYRQVARA